MIAALAAAWLLLGLLVSLWVAAVAKRDEARH